MSFIFLLWITLDSERTRIYHVSSNLGDQDGVAIPFWNFLGLAETKIGIL